MLGRQAAAGAHHGAMGVEVQQGVGVGMVQRRLRVLRSGWVLELKLRFELLLVHAGRPIVRKPLWGEAGATISWDPFELALSILSVCFCDLKRS